ncbi:MAG: protein kinase domain-containing protein [Myxococcaceae bacterium]
MNSALQQRPADAGAGPRSLPSDWEFRIGAGSGAGRVLVVPATGGTLGADPSCTLLVLGEGVAGVHLRIVRQPDGALGWEAATPASVLLDGQPARSGPLVDGSRLQLGALVVVVVRRPGPGLPSFPSAPPEAPDQLLPPGTVLGERYRIEEVIGQGGMGTVYRAQHLALGKTFAVKVLKAMHSARPDFVARFQREAVAASQIRHPGIVDVFDFGRAGEGSFYCVMEYLEGETLAARLARLGALPVAEAVRVGRDMARALSAAHTQGIFHRDIKPENVLLVPEAGGADTIKLVDFGIARLADPARDSRETGEGIILGTPQYMSPEQASGLAQDARADVYSLGVLLWELLAGAAPFRGASATHVLAAHLLEPAPRLPHSGPHGPIPRRLARLLARMMAKRPEDRPARMQDVVAELDGVFAPRGPWAGWAAATLAILALASAAGALVLFLARHPQRPQPSAPVAALDTGARAATSVPAPTPLPGPRPAASLAPAPVAPAPPSSPGVPAGPLVPLDIASEPTGATVAVDGRPMGVTPLRLALRQGVPVRLKLSHAGYTPESRVVRPRPGIRVQVGLEALPDATLPDLKESPY